MKTQTLNAKMVPEGFTLSMALVDALPVLLFCGSSFLVAKKFGSALFWAGAVLCIAAGMGKVLWKIIIVARKQNAWLLNRQMRYLMPLGFLLMLLAVCLCREQIPFAALWQAVFSLPAILFFSVGIIGMLCMMIYAKRLDGASAKANWLEQITNTAAQGMLFLGVLFTTGTL